MSTTDTNASDDPPVDGLTAIEVPTPTSERERLAHAVVSALDFAGSFTDLLIHEGSPIVIKSARGVIPLADLLPFVDGFVVTRKDIESFFAYYLDSFETLQTDNSALVHDREPGAYWRAHVAPALARKEAVNRSLRATSSHFLRCSLFQYQGSKIALVIRVTTPPPALTAVGLTEQILDRLMFHPAGLLIITGPTASGKTATAYSILSWINANGSGHVVTVEDPVEYPIEPQHCAFTQREVSVDVESFGAGLRDALRQCPDVILAGEMRDRDTAEAAILGGESGALMIVTTHGSSIVGTLRKILALTGDQSAAMRSVLAGSLIGVVKQELVPLVDGKGYALLADTLHGTPSVQAMIDAGDWTALDKLTRSPTSVGSKSTHDAFANATPSGAPAEFDFVPMRPRLLDLVASEMVDKELATGMLRLRR